MARVEWKLADADPLGVDSARLDEIAHAAGSLLPGIESLLVARHGSLLLERYFNGATPASRIDRWSITKSVLSALVGIAVEAGSIDSLERTLEDFFPDHVGRARDRRVRRITLRQLLTMTGGFAANVSLPFRWMESADWLRELLGRPLSHEPGSTFAYDDGSSHLVSAALTGATGVSAETFARRHLFEPLGFSEEVRWRTDPQGYSSGGTGLHLTAREMATFGELFLQHGAWPGVHSVVPARWVRQSTARQAHIAELEYYGFLWSGYGFHWWRYPSDGLRQGFVASGYGGQSIFVWPDLGLIVVTTGHEFGDDSNELWRPVRSVICDPVLATVS